MRVFSFLRSVVAALLHRSRIDSEMGEELRAHMEDRANDLERSGVPRAEAERRARLEFGGYQKFKEECREATGVTFFESLAQDVRYGLRMLRKSPGFTTVAVLTLALGIGANTAIFSLINAVMLKMLPVKDPQQLVLLHWEADKWPPQFSMTGWRAEFSFSYPAFEDFRAQTKALSSAFAWVPLGFNDQNTTVGVGGRPALADGQMVTGEYFSGLGVTPLLGRVITEADESPAAPRAVVISYAYWTRQFARDPAIIGKTVMLNGIPFSIVGVTPPKFYGASTGTEPDLWVPFDDRPNMRPWSKEAGTSATSVFTARDWLCLNVMGRLADGVNKLQAQSALDAVFRHFVTAEWHPTNPDSVPHLTLAEGSQGLPVLSRYAKQPLFVLMAAVGLLLLIACANVATLLLARATARHKEISVRLAIGASRSRLIRQLLTESVIMAGLGGLLALAFANWGTEALVFLLSNSNSELILDHRMDSRVLLFMFLVSVLTGILFGLAPAMRASKVDLGSAMKDVGINLSDGSDRHRLGQSLIVAQVAASVLLMIGAGLFVRTLVNFESDITLGFDQRNLLSFELDPTRAGYHDVRLLNLYSELLDRIQSLPGVESATLISNAPLSGWSSQSEVTTEDAAKMKGDSKVRWHMAGPDFFRTMGIPVILGRGIQRTDTATSPRVSVVDETFARKFFAGQNPVGHRFSLGTEFDPQHSFEIVGVSKRAELIDLTKEPTPYVSMSYAQFPQGLNAMFFEVRAQGPSASVISQLRNAVRELDPSLPLIGLKNQAEQTGHALLLQHLFARLTTVFGLLSLLLASIGLYGMMAYTLTRRTREIGVRMALGANPAAVFAMAIRQGLALTLAGIAIGVAAALGVTRLMRSLIFGVTPYDPLTFVAVAVLLLGVAVAACYIPARRAMRVDPMVALRHE